MKSFQNIYYTLMMQKLENEKKYTSFKEINHNLHV